MSRVVRRCRQRRRSAPTLSSVTLWSATLSPATLSPLSSAATTPRADRRDSLDDARRIRRPRQCIERASTMLRPSQSYCSCGQAGACQ
mmetsp:Transcript_27707/g.85673  ORF Transcript_27707/g.85673 Transcript_27707/m.85673 type:complete len:88 (-) Transcript_27707:1195-1458(-)